MKYLLLLTLTLPFLCNSQILTQDFEGALGGNGLPTGWTETGLSTDGIYTVGNAAAASSPYLTYPAHTTFAFTNDDSCNCDKSADRLILPAQDFTSYTVLQMRFSYYLNGGYGETGDVEVSTNGGTNWTSVMTLVPNAAAWTDNQVVDLSAYAGVNNVLIAFRYNDQSNWGYSLGVDDVYLDNSVLSTEDFQLKNAISLYPNPTNNTLFLNKDISFSQIKIINILGQEVLIIQKEKFVGAIDVSGLDSGTYFLQIDLDGIKKTLKFIKN